MEDELAESEASGWKLYGPYKRKDGRKHVCLIKHAEDGSIAIRRTKSYPKYLVEQKLGRLLRVNETIDHQDRDFTNDSVVNLVVRVLSSHASADALRVKVEPVSCPICRLSFTPTKHQRNQKSRDVAGPFCSKKCAGRYGTNVQNGADRLSSTTLVKSYYRLDKEDYGIKVFLKSKPVVYIFETVREAIDHTGDDYGTVYQNLCKDRRHETVTHIYMSAVESD